MAEMFRGYALEAFMAEMLRSPNGRFPNLNDDIMPLKFLAQMDQAKARAFYAGELKFGPQDDCQSGTSQQGADCEDKVMGFSDGHLIHLESLKREG